METLELIDVEDLIGRKIVDAWYPNFPGYGFVLDDGRAICVGHVESNKLAMWVEEHTAVTQI